ncbi:hypothetical protein [Mycoplasmopsis gallopavonis]|uniref:Uncharacterized protein n=1 Tax=Mycoplasmopsis gallopavonis TaxID=76629 RepID=A0A449B090_9BACT|nr:hypothetical protein [Mycoplasmopsis gallopavonis]RIV16850.1 hypothetical protein D1113_00715 [Mycoplasmopsis gallopavonis]VEU73154.1 Uncharacterised protein [Mycoplasmopsis gallopavonis]
MQEEQNLKMDLIEFRKQEIQHAILKAQKEQEQAKYKKEQLSLPWYKQDLIRNLFAATGSLLLIVILMVVALYVG